MKALKIQVKKKNAPLQKRDGLEWKLCNHGCSLLGKLPHKAQSNVKKEYKDLFSQDLTEDITML